MQAVRIEKMQPAHAEAAAAIEKDLFGQPWSREGFLSSLANPDAFYLAAFEEEKLVGYCGFFQSFDEAEITNVAVAPSGQNKGIGRAMLKELIGQGRERGVERYILEVRVSNERAIHLYEKLGFLKVGVRRGFYEKPKEDALIMCLNH